MCRPQKEHARIVGNLVLPCLQFQQDELHLLFEQHCKNLGLDLELWAGFEHVLAARSERQPGLFMMLLDKMKDYGLPNYPTQIEALKAFLEHMGTRDFYDSLKALRCFRR